MAKSSKTRALASTRMSNPLCVCVFRRLCVCVCGLVCVVCKSVFRSTPHNPQSDTTLQHRCLFIVLLCLATCNLHYVLHCTQTQRHPALIGVGGLVGLVVELLKGTRSLTKAFSFFDRMHFVYNCAPIRLRRNDDADWSSTRMQTRMKWSYLHNDKIKQ